MKIGVLSDTHIPKVAPDLPSAILKAFEKVDLILHAGDIVDLRLLEKLKEYAPVEAVCGNMDPWNVQDSLPKKKIVTVGAIKIGLIHGWGNPKTVADVVGREFTGVDAIVFGHSHEAMNKKRGHVLYFNPGSPTDRIFASYTSYGMLEVDKGIRGKIIRL